MMMTSSPFDFLLCHTQRCSHIFINLNPVNCKKQSAKKDPIIIQPLTLPVTMNLLNHECIEGCFWLPALPLEAVLTECCILECVSRQSLCAATEILLMRLRTASVQIYIQKIPA